MRTTRQLASLLALFLVGACNQPRAGHSTVPEPSGNSDELEVAGTPTVAGEVGGASGEPIKPGPGIKRLVDVAKRDLATVAGVEVGTIETLEADYVTWRDSSLGCPSPGSEAMQVLTPGARIRLRVDGRVFHYHSGPDRPPFLCSKPSPVDPLPYGPGEA